MKKNSENALRFINEICKEETIKCNEVTKNLAKNSIITEKSKTDNSSRSLFYFVFSFARARRDER